ncbi:YciK family oxidoreductase [Candidatus Purcelliella pentastirinorum]|uniref:Putative oxidoreductase n=1 Tax=Candidatus Purcelliella pentastirinorum TaxID=472834 RepID=A0A346E023_9ENTR|nr:YciK family oxidoreductase [Candidatus Purcelliella pentastirinorum]AXN02328.1 putative oxidoreductase [Candidatus Purcelliella pentastirinorum]WDI78878.1 YciK family oxidoreductase [Candidatus Purcelliella pentastirinorum]WDR80011.1 YciK family oxidoreductase [Candidatus Purcelliella pentastirinorum]
MNYIFDVNLLKDRVILITGATGDIGKCVAITYAKCGAKVILLGRNFYKLRNVKNYINSIRKFSASSYVIDMNKLTYNNAKKFVSKVKNKYVKLDGVLHNSGDLGLLLSINKYPIYLWKRVIRVNLDSVFILTRVLLPLLLKSSSSSLLFTTSSVGRIGRSKWGAYSISKFAIEGMMQILSLEYKDTSLRVNCVNPGQIRTKMRTLAYPNEDVSLLNDPIDIMPMYLYLMSNDSIKKTGFSFDV